METKATSITVEATVNSPVEKVWKIWTSPEHITRWNSATPDWHTPFAENDVKVGGKFRSRMEAKDGSMGFDFGGVYNRVETNKLMQYTIDDGRKVQVSFTPVGKQTRVVETFDAETVNSIELQKNGWQSILDNFKRYTESV